MKFRTATSAVVALAAALALSACSPPGEVPTDEHVDTATTGPAEPEIFTTEKAVADRNDDGSVSATDATDSNATTNGIDGAVDQGATGVPAGAATAPATGAGATNSMTSN